MSNYHVMQKKGQRNWNVQKERGKKASAIVSTQKQAERLAKEFSGKNGGDEVRIHKPKGGPIRDSDTVKPGNDPIRSKDTKH